MSSSFTLHIEPDNRDIVVPAHTVLHEALDCNGISLTAYCDGMGVCGKCIVEIRCADGMPVPETDEDRRHLTSEQRAEGLRLACRWNVVCNATVRIPDASRIENLAATAKDSGTVSTGAAHVNAAQPFGIAVDLGTTTVVGSLLDCRTGRTVAVASRLNGQHRFGADVISRVKYSVEAADGPGSLQREGIATINDIIGDIIGQSGIPAASIADVAITGNSVMLHALLRKPMHTLAVLPFEPAFREATRMPAAELGLALNGGAQAYVFPIVAGFVGGDTVSCMLATNMDTADECSMVIDIGTNGEVALGCARGLITASAPAGPAFEGATISCGMRGAKGAIEHVQITPDALISDVIGEVAPAGVCGTGLIDATAALLDWGIIDETGRILCQDELPDGTPGWLRARICERNGQQAFVLFDPETDEYYDNGDAPRTLVLTQRDFRELQLAKAAVAAACDLLLQHKGMTYGDLACINLAGAFGNYLRPAQARRIGLLPDVPLENIHFVGNAASTGAKRTLVSLDDRARAERIAREAAHVELAADPAFQMCFAGHMLFPASV